MNEPDTPDSRPRREGPRLASWSVVFTCGVCFAVLLQWGLESTLQRDRGPLDGRVVSEVADLISRNYVEERSEQELLIGALRGMAADLDRYSAYISPRELPSFVEDTEGEYAGVGILVNPVAGGLEVEGVLPGGPAHAAGIRPGDLIHAIEELDAPARAPAVPLRERLRGPSGTRVLLHVAPREASGPAAGSAAVDDRLVVVTRGEVSIPSVSIAAIVDPARPSGYIRIAQFQSTTPGDLVRAIELLEKRGPLGGLVLDLRDNPGGVLSSALEVATELLPEGVTIVSTRGRSTREGSTREGSTRGRGGDPRGTDYRTKRAGRWKDLPVAILVNGDTASAAEIVAAALQDNGRAVVVGERTYGKGRVQTIYSIRDDAERYGLVKLTTQRFYTPSGRAIDRDHSPRRARGNAAAPATAAGSKDTGGVFPDIAVPSGSEAFRRELARHLRDRSLDLWRRGSFPETPEEYRVFTWTDPETGKELGDRQLAEAIAVLSSRDIYDHVIERSKRASVQARKETGGPGARTSDADTRY